MKFREKNEKENPEIIVRLEEMKEKVEEIDKVLKQILQKGCKRGK